MNVFVESNFVLELALEQEETRSCERLIELAQVSSIRLLIPSYSFIEPHETLTRRRIDRDALRLRVLNELNQLARSAALAEGVASSQEIVNLLAESSVYETRRVEHVTVLLCSVAEVLPLSLSVIQAAGVCRSTFDLSPQDAMVYASIRARLELDHASASCFVSRNPRDFDGPNIGRDLASFNCKFFSSFVTAVRYIEHATASRPDA